MMQTFADYNIDTPTGVIGEIRTLCPECSHQRQKSSEKCLAVNADKGTWFCHHCGHSGGLKSDVTDKKPISTYRKPEYKKLDLPKKVIDWFLERGIPESILSKNQIGYGQSFKDKQGIQFPYIKGGVVVNVKHRSGDKGFRQEKGAEKCLYRFDEVWT